jgi:hypothetical protein
MSFARAKTRLFRIDVNSCKWCPSDHNSGTGVEEGERDLEQIECLAYISAKPLQRDCISRMVGIPHRTTPVRQHTKGVLHGIQASKAKRTGPSVSHSQRS